MNDNPSILIVEDEENIRYSLITGLRREGFETIVAENGETALELARKHTPDLILLDLMLPDISGMDVCRILRRETDIPIIMVTARDAEPDVIAGLELGADDYITKPFSLSVLLARVRANLRRRKKKSPAKRLQVGNLILDSASYEAQVEDEHLDLTPRLFNLLFYLAQKNGVVCTRDEILDEIWGYEYFGETRTLDVHIYWLREKLLSTNADIEIRTVRGVGYRLVVEQD